MSRFYAEIPLDPKGYEMANFGRYDPEDGEEHYYGSLYVRWNSQDDLAEQYCKCYDFVFESYYDPFVKEPALFRIFAALDPCPEEILAFANKYGDFSGPSDAHEGLDTPLVRWILEIEEMSVAIKEADKFMADQREGRNKTKAVKAALELANETLGTTQTFLKAVQQNGGVGFRVVAYNLLDAMKLQLVDAITEQKRYRTCEQCGKPFEITPQVNRSDRMFCSDNCRVKACYRRKKQAIALRHEGQTLREIVKATGSDMETIKKWVSDAKPKEHKNA